jgi:hypothetical protein
MRQGAVERIPAPTRGMRSVTPTTVVALAPSDLPDAATVCMAPSLGACAFDALLEQSLVGA